MFFYQFSENPPLTGLANGTVFTQIMWFDFMLSSMPVDSQEVVFTRNPDHTMSVSLIVNGAKVLDGKGNSMVEAIDSIMRSFGSLTIDEKINLVKHAGKRSPETGT